MIRTSLTLPAPLHQRLLMAAQYHRQTVSELIRGILDEALAAKEESRIERMYEALDQFNGIGPKGITDASTTINETLYGDYGAWRPAEA